MNREDLIVYATKQEPVVKDKIADLFYLCSGLRNTTVDGASASIMIDYDELDMYRAFSVFFDVATNYAIKREVLTMENIQSKILHFKQSLFDTFGFDVEQETNVNQLLDVLK